jgi:hypothetical protein
MTARATFSAPAPRRHQATRLAIAALMLTVCLAAGCAQTPSSAPAQPVEPVLTPSGIYYSPQDAEWMPPSVLPDFALLA